MLRYVLPHTPHYTILRYATTQHYPFLTLASLIDFVVFVFGREAVFIDEILKPLIQDFPDLKVVMEHITTKDAADFVASQGPNLAATITAHHLLYNRYEGVCVYVIACKMCGCVNSVICLALLGSNCIFLSVCTLHFYFHSVSACTPAHIHTYYLYKHTHALNSARNVIFKGGINPHYYCLPVLKRETHRRALVKAALSGTNMMRMCMY